MQQGNRNPMDERKELPREQDTERERMPNRRLDMNEDSERERGIEIDKTPGEQRKTRTEPMTEHK